MCRDWLCIQYTTKLFRPSLSTSRLMKLPKRNTIFHHLNRCSSLRAAIDEYELPRVQARARNRSTQTHSDESWTIKSTTRWKQYRFFHVQISPERWYGMAWHDISCENHIKYRSYCVDGFLPRCNVPCALQVISLSLSIECSAWTITFIRMPNLLGQCTHDIANWLICKKMNECRRTRWTATTTHSQSLQRLLVQLVCWLLVVDWMMCGEKKPRTTRFIKCTLHINFINCNRGEHTHICIGRVR